MYFVGQYINQRQEVPLYSVRNNANTFVQKGEEFLFLQFLAKK